jgi:hypothetical protein
VIDLPGAKTVPEFDLFELLGLALSEKQISQVDEDTEKAKCRMEPVGIGRYAPKAGVVAESLTLYSEASGIAIQFLGRGRNSASSLVSMPTASSALL